MRRGNTKSKIVCGVDEAGRGSLAGPVVAAAVAFSGDISIDHLTDSKLLSPAKRYQLFSEIIDKADCFAISGISYSIIDKINILNASLLAMRRAVEKLPISPDIVYVDGNREIQGLSIDQCAVTKGDRKIRQVSAASILAKVARDAYMTEISNLYPEYGFEFHKGYGTKEHLEVLNRIGPCQCHRRSFKPVSQLSFLGG